MKRSGEGEGEGERCLDGDPFFATWMAVLGGSEA